MEMIALDKELKENSYPGRGIIIGRSADGTKAVTAYFIMGRSETAETVYLWRMARESAHRHLTLPNW